MRGDAVLNENLYFFDFKVKKCIGYSYQRVY